MSTLHVLMPPLAHADAHPAFHHWLARGDRLPDARNGRMAAVRDHFRFDGDGVPTRRNALIGPPESRKEFKRVAYRYRNDVTERTPSSASQRLSRYSNRAYALL